MDLQRLDLTHNAIAELAPDVGNLTGLVSLRLAHNALRRLPREAFAIATLKQLDASEYVALLRMQAAVVLVLWLLDSHGDDVYWSRFVLTDTIC